MKKIDEKRGVATDYKICTQAHLLQRKIKIVVFSDILFRFTLIKSNLSLYSLYYAESCNEFAGPISASLRPGNTDPFEKMLQRWRAVGNTVSDLTGPRFEPQTSRSRDERVTA